MKLGYSTWGMPAIPIDKAVEHIAGLGFDGIEIAVLPRYTTSVESLGAAERRAIADLLNRHNLVLSAVAGHASLLETDAEAHEANVARLQLAVDLAVELANSDDPPIVNTLSGGRSEDWDDQHELFIERMAEQAVYAEDRGVILAMEPHIGGLVDTPERMRYVLDQVESRYLRVNFDISHFDILGMSIEESVQALIAYSVHAHVKDQSGRYPDHQFLIPGEGNFDYVTYLQTMERYGYDGFISAEVSTMVQRRPDYDPMAAAELSYRTLSRAFVDAGIEH